MQAVLGGVSTTISFQQSSELFDRARLFVDLDEATDPVSPDSVLLVVGLHGLGGGLVRTGSNLIVSRLRDRFVAVVGDSGATYGTRSTELCAILEGSSHDLVELLGAIHEGIAREAAKVDVRVSTGVVDLPREAAGAPEALALADRRLTAANGPIRDH